MIAGVVQCVHGVVTVVVAASGGGGGVAVFAAADASPNLCEWDAVGDGSGRV